MGKAGQVGGFSGRRRPTIIIVSRALALRAFKAFGRQCLRQRHPLLSEPRVSDPNASKAFRSNPKLSNPRLSDPRASEAFGIQFFRTQSFQIHLHLKLSESNAFEPKVFWIGHQGFRIQGSRT